MWGRPPVWYDMKSNLALNKYKEFVFPGSILLALNAGPNRDEMNELSTPKLQNEDVSRMKHKANVIVQIFECVSLPRLDPNGFSDPYIKAKIGESKRGDKNIEYQVRQSMVKHRTLNPKWNGEVLLFSNVTLGHYLQIEVWDWDFVGDNEHCSSIDPIPLNGTDIDTHFKLNTSSYAIEKYPKNATIKNSSISISVRYEFYDPEKQKRRRKKKSIFNPLDLFSTKDPGLDIQALPRPIMTPMQLRVFVYQAKNLENRDAYSLTDAYMVVRFCGQIMETRTIDNHIDPQWFEVLILNDIMVPWDEVYGLNHAPRIYCELFDYDYLAKDETIGRFTVNPMNIYVDNHRNMKDITPTVYHLEDINHHQVEGEILVYFELSKDRQTNDIPRDKDNNIDIKPKTKLKWMHIITLGLRDIQSLFGVHKVYIEFEINGTVYETEHSNMPEPRNPNFNQLLHFKVLLPVDALFLPNLNVKIIDALCGGMIKRQIGYASIDLAELMEGDISNDFVNEEKEYKQEEDIEDEIKENENMGLLSGDEKHEKSGWSFGGLFGTKQKKKKKEIKEIKVEKKKKRKRDEYILGEEHTFATYDVMRDYELKDSRYSVSYMKGREKLTESGKGELEKAYKLTPFHKFPFFNGRNKKRHVGYFKGLISVTNESKDNFDNKYLREMMKESELYLRLYVLNGLNLKPSDLDEIAYIAGEGDEGKADPYLIVKFGNQKVSTRDRYIAKTLEPEFYEVFEFGITLPGPSQLKIEVWDWDGIGDDFIGQTVIDIEDRWYSKNWRDMKEERDNKMPLEYRKLYVDDSGLIQGTLELWVEILTIADRKKYPKINIKPPKPMEYELSQCIFCIYIG